MSPLLLTFRSALLVSSLLAHFRHNWDRIASTTGTDECLGGNKVGRSNTNADFQVQLHDEADFEDRESKSKFTAQSDLDGFVIPTSFCDNTCL